VILIAPDIQHFVPLPKETTTLASGLRVSSENATYGQLTAIHAKVLQSGDNGQNKYLLVQQCGFENLPAFH
jgi:hypothetical protein